MADDLGQSLGAMVSELTGEAGGLVTGAGSAFVNNLVSDAMSNVANLPIDHGLSSAGTMIATLLSGGQLAYLGLAAFLSTLLKAELQKRIEISLTIQDDMVLINTLVGYLQSLKTAGDTDKMLLALEQAYGYIALATGNMGDISNQLTYRDYYSVSKATKASSYLDSARASMRTPLADSIFEVVKSSGFATTGFFGKGLAHIESMTNPDVVWDSVNADNSSYDAMIAEKAAQRATKEEQTATLLKGLSAFTGVPFGSLLLAGELSKIIKDVKNDLSKYLPLSLSGLLGPAGAVVGAAFSDTLSLDTLTGMSKQRDLNSLNLTIESKITNIAKYASSWEGLNALTSVLLPQVNSTLKKITDLKADIGEYVGEDANKPLGSGAVLSLKMTLWKSQINSIQTNIDTISGLGATSEAIGGAYESLDTLLEAINTEALVYTEGVPESELAYDLIFKVLGEILQAVLGGSGLKEIQSQISESITSLKISQAADKVMLGRIGSFQSNVLSVPGIEPMLKMTASVLDTDKYKNSFLSKLIEDVRDGDLAGMMNMSMAAVTGTVDIAKNLKAAATGGEITTANPVLGAVLGSVGAMYSNLSDCVATILENNESAKLARIDALKEATEQSKIYGEDRKKAIADSIAIANKIAYLQEVNAGNIPLDGMSQKDAEAWDAANVHSGTVTLDPSSVA